MATSYFSPSYFPPSYFPNLSIEEVSAPIIDRSPARTRDRDAYQSMLDSITATGAFDQVVFGPAGPSVRGGADTYPVLMLTPKGWEEVDDADSTSGVRRASYTLSIKIRDEDPVRGFDELDRLSALAGQAINGSDLGGTAVPPLTKVRSARYLPATYPEQGVEIDGEFSSLFSLSNP